MKLGLRLRQTPGGDQVVLRVEDTGVGIPEADLPKIFDRFYRVDKARSREAGGTGLGLSIVRDTVRQNSGTVEVRRRAPEGTCFEVCFAPLEGKGGGRYERRSLPLLLSALVLSGCVLRRARRGMGRPMRSILRWMWTQPDWRRRERAARRSLESCGRPKRGRR